MSSLPLIYAHRGVWQSKELQNSKESILKTLELGFGIETDFRSSQGELVISHDPLYKVNYLNAKEVDFTDINLAINIKEDGLLEQFAKFICKTNSSKTFLFDGSIPEMYQIREKGLPHALRLSEFERELPWATEFIWVDAFKSDWWVNNTEIENYLRKHFLIFVSPEIHKRSNAIAWGYLKSLKNQGLTNFGVCTDLPIKFKEFIHEQN